MRSQWNEVLTPGQARSLAGLLDLPDHDIDDGWALPDLWHWVYLVDRPAQSELGPEGHVVRGIPEPPAAGLRRMFAGGRVTTRHRLRLGTAATRTIEVLDSRTRDGRAGKLTILTTRSTIEQDGRVAIIDEQDIVYRDATPLPVRSTTSDRSEEPPDLVHTVDVDPILLFRFSALTYNSHRIHYDVDYCRDEEDYAGLVVHGPLQALLMAHTAEQLRPLGPASAYFQYRLTAPLLLGEGLQVSATRTPSGAATAVRDRTGRATSRGLRTGVPPAS